MDHHFSYLKEIRKQKEKKHWSENLRIGERAVALTFWNF
jgi:hypothetical protein